MFSGLFSIPRHANYLATLAAGLRMLDAQQLAETVVLVPNQRSVRALREIFLDQAVNANSQGVMEGAAIIPRLMTFGDLAADDAALSLDALLEGEPLLPPISGAERLLHLSRFVQAQDASLNSVQAVALARDLGNLFNEIALYEAKPDALPGLVENADLAKHWEHTLKFTTVVTTLWPDYLAKIGRSDPALHRGAVLQRLADAWAAQPPAFPVIIAGVQRAEPVLMRLAKAVLKNPHGAVVLPGFDAALADDVWRDLDIVHPDRLLADVVRQLGPARADVKPWPATPPVTPLQQARAQTIGLAMLPAAYTKTWASDAARLVTADALQGLTRITADDEAHEAAIIALIIRKEVEDANQTISLLTADRTLARRVAALLQRWGIVADDSSGLPFAVSRLSLFLQLVAKLAGRDAGAVDLLALLKHPLCGVDADVPALEVLALRGHYPAPGFAGLIDHLRRQNYTPLADTLQKACGDFAMASQARQGDAATLLRAHLHAAEALANEGMLWFGAEGEVASREISTILETLPQNTQLDTADYLPWLMQLLATCSVRVSWGQHPRVTIHGLIEARLQQADVMIVAGLNEGVWPALPAANPWLNRKMRTALGLPSPDEVIAQQAHDFVSALAAPKVYMTRAERQGGAPTVPARWWHRLSAVLAPAMLNERLDDAGYEWAEWAQQLDAAKTAYAAVPPAPCPPLHARPNKVSVTTVEMWMRNPYGLYAKQVLGLATLDDLAEAPGAAERGTFIHKALEDFTRRTQGRVLAPADRALFDECGQAALAEYKHLPGITAFWWPRFQEVSRWWWQKEMAARPQRLPQVVETRGQHTFNGWKGGAFTLHASPDRVDSVQGGAVHVLDYKTGDVPSKKNMIAGISPQLMLEGVLVRHGAFDAVAKDADIIAEYWQLGGTADRCAVKHVTRIDTDAVEAGLKSLVEAFADVAQPYHPVPIAARKPKYNDYDHLARTAEWMIADDEGEAA